MKKTYTEDINHILNICSASSDGITPASVEEVEVVLKKLKPNKAADCLDITCEHLIFVLEFYSPVNNEVMSSRSVNSGTVPGQA